MEFGELNTSFFPTPHPSDSPAQPISNTRPDPSPVKTGNNREMEFEELNTPFFPTRVREANNRNVVP
jgi:hypothetical protein